MALGAVLTKEVQAEEMYVTSQGNFSSSMVKGMIHCILPWQRFREWLSQDSVSWGGDGAELSPSHPVRGRQLEHRIKRVCAFSHGDFGGVYYWSITKPRQIGISIILILLRMGMRSVR